MDESTIPFSLRGYCYTNRRVLIILGIVITAFLFCYAGVFSTMVGQWLLPNMTYSYGSLIPLISFYLLWRRRERLFQIQPDPNYTGGSILLLSGLSALLMGQAGGVIALQEISLIITLTGIVLLLLGKQFLRAMGVPIAYLLFMIPAWSLLTDRIHYPFQMLSAYLGVKLLQTFGIPAYRQASYIELPNITLEVARVCSGVNYLIAVIAIGIPAAYIFLKGWLRRALLVSFAVIIAILSNGLRVALVGILSYYNLSKGIHGPYHILQGIFVSMIGYAAIFAGLWALSEEGSVRRGMVRGQGIRNSIGFIMKKREIQYLGISLSALLLLIGSYNHFYSRAPVPLKTDLQSFPLEIGEWKGVETIRGNDIYKGLGVDHALSRTYKRTSGETLRFYIGYYEHQEQGKELIDYRTKELNLNASRTKIDVMPYGVIEINQVIQQQGNQKKLILFWYDLNGRIVADRYIAKGYTSLDALIRGRTNGAVILLSSDFQSPEDLQRILSRNEIFIMEIFPLLKDYLPQN